LEAGILVWRQENAQSREKFLHTTLSDKQSLNRRGKLYAACLYYTVKRDFRFKRIARKVVLIWKACDKPRMTPVLTRAGFDVANSKEI
jgi:hypothetical protein